MTDLIRRSVLIDEICRSSIYKWSVEEDQAAHNWALNIINSQHAVVIPCDAEVVSADAESDDLIIKGAKGIQDGLYNIKDGKLFKYKANGGTVRTYPIVPSADAVHGWRIGKPTEQGEYMVTIDSFGHKRIDLFYYGKPMMPNRKVRGKCWYRSDDEWGDVVYDDTDILAWQPLPKPYKGGDTE